MINFISAFPVLIGHLQNVINEEQALQITELCLNYPNSKPIGFPLIGDSLSIDPLENIDFLDYIQNNVPYCSKIKELILQHVNDYCVEYGYPEMFFLNSWFNIQNPDSVLQQHTHPNSVISGALYINTDTDSSKLVFENPNPYSWNTHFSNSSTKYSSRYITFTPSIGDLIIFPSWLKHGSLFQKNKTQNRIVVSFNCWEFNSQFI